MPHALADGVPFAEWKERIASHLDTYAARKVAGYEEVLADHRRLVRELDVEMNGEEGAAKQASLCDLIGEHKRKVAEAVAVERERCAKIAASWQRADAIKLAASEMTAQELRTARAVAGGIESAIRNA